MVFYTFLNVIFQEKVSENNLKNTTVTTQETWVVGGDREVLT